MAEQIISWICDKCDKDCYIDDRDYYMLQHALWKKIAINVDGMLCMDCVENILGRKLMKKDILPCTVTKKWNPYTAAILKGITNKKQKVRKSDSNS